MITGRQIRKGLVGLGVFLSSFAGCPMSSDTSGLPPLNSTEGRTYTLHEGDIQAESDETLSTSFTVPYVCQVLGVNVEVPDQEGRKAPFDGTFTGSTTTSEDGKSTRVDIDFNDNEETYTPGQTNDVVITAVTNGLVPRAIRHTIKVRYESGISGATAQEELNVIREQLGDLEQAVTMHISQQSPPAHTPSGGTDQSSDDDPNRFFNDGNCGVGETWRTEYACTIPGTAYKDSVSISIQTLDGKVIAAPDVPQTEGLVPGQEYQGVFSIDRPLVEAYRARGWAIPESELKKTGSSACTSVIGDEPSVYATVDGGVEEKVKFVLLAGPDCHKDATVEYFKNFGDDETPIKFIASAQYWHPKPSE